MFINMFTVGWLGTNCFILSSAQTKEAIVIDPGFDNSVEAENILREIQRGKLEVKFIINTHGHPDHVGGNKQMKEATGASILIHEYDASMLRDSRPDRILHEDDTIEAGDIKLRVLHTPGHTKGSISLLEADCLFVGDTLFYGSIGRYDFPEGSLEELMNSIINKLLRLPDYVKVYPGHNGFTTIGEERRSNPFLQSSSRF